MRAARIVKRQAQREQLARYKKMFQTVTPIIQAQRQLNDAYVQGLAHGKQDENTRITTAAHSLTYEDAQ